MIAPIINHLVKVSVPHAKKVAIPPWQAAVPYVRRGETPVSFVAAGSALGAGTYAVIGGAGLTILGTGVAVPVAAFTVVGGTLGLAGYGAYKAVRLVAGV